MKYIKVFLFGYQTCCEK